MTRRVSFPPLPALAAAREPFFAGFALFLEQHPSTKDTFVCREAAGQTITSSDQPHSSLSAHEAGLRFRHPDKAPNWTQQTDEMSSRTILAADISFGVIHDRAKRSRAARRSEVVNNS